MARREYFALCFPSTLHYAFPLLIIQTIPVVFLSRLLAFLLKPLRQPNVVDEILVSSVHCRSLQENMELATAFVGRDYAWTVIISEEQSFHTLDFSIMEYSNS